MLSAWPEIERMLPRKKKIRSMKTRALLDAALEKALAIESARLRWLVEHANTPEEQAAWRLLLRKIEARSPSSQRGQMFLDI